MESSQAADSTAKSSRGALPTDSFLAVTKKQNGGRKASVFYLCPAICQLSQPSRRVREQGVDQPGFRGEVAAQRLRPAILARDFVKQPLELGDVAVDRLLEVAVGAIFARDLVERLLTSRRIKPLGEGLALAALIAIPHLGREIAIHQTADVQRQRVQRIAALRAALATAGRRRRGGRVAATAAGLGPVQQVGQPA